MGSIDIIKPLSNVLSSAINKSHEHQEKNTLECRELNLGLLGEKQVCYLSAMYPPYPLGQLTMLLFFRLGRTAKATPPRWTCDQVWREPRNEKLLQRDEAFWAEHLSSHQPLKRQIFVFKSINRSAFVQYYPIGQPFQKHF